VTEDEAKAAIRRQGWTPRRRKDAKGHQFYLYAYHRIGGKVVEKYIAPLSQLERMTESEIVAKLS